MSSDVGMGLVLMSELNVTAILSVKTIPMNKTAVRV